MEVNLTPDQEAFLQHHVQVGRFASTDKAVREAVSLLEERASRESGQRPANRKSLAQLFAESPFRGADMDFPRDKEPFRPVDL